MNLCQLLNADEDLAQGPPVSCLFEVVCDGKPVVATAPPAISVENSSSMVFVEHDSEVDEEEQMNGFSWDDIRLVPPSPLVAPAIARSHPQAPAPPSQAPPLPTELPSPPPSRVPSRKKLRKEATTGGQLPALYLLPARLWQRVFSFLLSVDPVHARRSVPLVCKSFQTIVGLLLVAAEEQASLPEKQLEVVQVPLNIQAEPEPDTLTNPVTTTLSWLDSDCAAWWNASVETLVLEKSVPWMRRLPYLFATMKPHGPTQEQLSLILPLVAHRLSVEAEREAVLFRELGKYADCAKLVQSGVWQRFVRMGIGASDVKQTAGALMQAQMSSDLSSEKKRAALVKQRLDTMQLGKSVPAALHRDLEAYLEKGEGSLDGILECMVNLQWAEKHRYLNQSKEVSTAGISGDTGLCTEAEVWNYVADRLATQDFCLHHLLLLPNGNGHAARLPPPSLWPCLEATYRQQLKPMLETCLQAYRQQTRGEAGIAMALDTFWSFADAFYRPGFSAAVRYLMHFPERLYTVEQQPNVIMYLEHLFQVCMWMLDG